MVKMSMTLRMLRFATQNLAMRKYLKEWLSEPMEFYNGSPCMTKVEIDDAVARWIGFSRYHCSLTAVSNGIPCRIDNPLFATL